MAVCCLWCRAELSLGSRRDAKFCSKKCRQTAFRLRKLGVSLAASSDDRSMRVAYADPPYPGLARKYYSREQNYEGEVDHVALVASLLQDYDGCALSTSAKALRDVLPLFPPSARVCAWTKAIGAAPLTYGPHNTWEPLIVVSARRLRPGVRDWLRAQPARGGGTLPGRKPIAFCAWLFALLGMLPGDELVDLFPGTGVVGRAWAELSSRARDDASPNSKSANTSTSSWRREHGHVLRQTAR